MIRMAFGVILGLALYVAQSVSASAADAGLALPPAQPTIKTSSSSNPPASRPSTPRPPAPAQQSVELPILDEEPVSVEPVRTSSASSSAASSADVREYCDRASECAARSDWTGAEENLRMALKLDPQNAGVVLDLAKALMEQGKEEPAVAVLAGYGGEDVRITQALGEIYVSTNRLKEAEQVYMDLSLRRPADAYHRYNLGLVESRMGKMDMAENAYLRATELDPKFSDARYNLALLYLRQKEYPKALTQLEEAVRLREDADYLINYGVVLRELNRFPASQAALEKALSLDPGNVLALNNLGITHYLAGNIPDAKKAFAEVTSIAPEDPTAKTFLSRIATEPPPKPRPVEVEARPADDQVAAMPPSAEELPEVEPAPQPRARTERPAIHEPKPEPKTSQPKSRTPAPHGTSRGVSAAEQTRSDYTRESGVTSDLERLRRENREMKEQLAFLEGRVDEMKRGMFKQMASDEKVQAARVGSALQKAQDKLQKKEKDLAKMAAEAEKKKQVPAEVPGDLDYRLDDLQKTLATARLELEQIRHQQGPVAFSPEPGSPEDRLDAADRTVQQMQRQIRQLSIERDMLRAEIETMRSGAGATVSPTRSGRTNINTADIGSLLTIPGMEERLAHNVLWYRQNIGAFRSVTELKKVPGMDESHYAQMVDHVTVGGAS